LEERIRALSFQRLRAERAFQEQNSRIHDLEQALVTARSTPQTPQTPAPPPGPTTEQQLQALDSEISTLEGQLDQAMETNEVRAISRIRSELRTKERLHSDLRVKAAVEAAKPPPSDPINPDEIVSQATERATTLSAYQNTLAKVKADFPALDLQGPQANPDLVSEVDMLYQSMLGPRTPADAMQTAVDYVMARHGVKPASAVQAAGKGKANGDQRQQDAINRNIDASNNTPPNTAGMSLPSSAGGTTTNMDFEKMSIEEFMAIPDDKLNEIEAVLARHEG
jgi:hypothetical protein